MTYRYEILSLGSVHGRSPSTPGLYPDIGACRVQLNNDGRLDLGYHPNISPRGVEVFHGIERIRLGDLDLVGRDTDTRLPEIADEKRFRLGNCCFQGITLGNRPEYFQPGDRDLTLGRIRRQYLLGG